MRVVCLLLLLGSLGCGKSEPPVPPAQAPKRVVPAPPARPVAQAPSPEPKAVEKPPAPEVPAPPPPPAPPAAAPAPVRPPRTFRAPARPEPADFGQQWPSFVFRTMDHRTAIVVLNGEDYTETTGLWTLLGTTVFDPKIPVPVWPPPGSRPCGSVARLEEPMETPPTLFLQLAQPSPELEKQYPHLQAGEHVLFVKGGGRQGALRLRVEGRDHRIYRWTEYLPIGTEANQEPFRRTLWFEAAE